MTQDNDVEQAAKEKIRKEIKELEAAATEAELRGRRPFANRMRSNARKLRRRLGDKE